MILDHLEIHSLILVVAVKHEVRRIVEHRHLEVTEETRLNHI